MSYNIINPDTACDHMCSICLDNLNKEPTYILSE